MSDFYELSSGIWISEVKLGDYNVRSVLICGEERVVIWDTLSHPEDMNNFLPLIGKKELVIVYSHADWDHIWGTEKLNHKKADIIGHTSCLARFSSDVPEKLKEKLGESSKWKEVKLIPPTITFSENYSLDLGNLTLNLHSLPGHTKDAIVGFLTEKGVLLLGDTVETPFPVLSEKKLIPGWIKELKMWEEDDRVKTVVLSHGDIGGREIISQNIIYLQSLLDGTDIEIPEMLTDFYRTGHQANLRVCSND